MKLKSILFSILFTIYFLDLVAQKTSSNASNNLKATEKKVIDLNALNNWPSVDNNLIISNEGGYLIYKIRNKWGTIGTLIMQSIQGGWKFELNDIKSSLYDNTNRILVCLNSNDSLCILTLGKDSVEYISQIKSYQLFKQNGEEWLAYHLNASDKRLVLRNLSTGKEQHFYNIQEYLISLDGKILITKKESNCDTNGCECLNWVYIPLGNSKIIWIGMNASNLILDNSGTQLSFIVQKKSNNKIENSIWYYKSTERKAIQLINNQSPEINDGFEIGSISQFSKYGEKIFVTLKEKDTIKPSSDATRVDIWSYTDAKLQSQQLKELEPKSFLAVILIDSAHLICLQKENDQIDVRTDDFLLVENSQGDNFREGHWNSKAQISSYLISTNSGIRKKISKYLTYKVSANDKFIIGYESQWGDIYSYELSTGIIRNITKSVPVLATSLFYRDDEDRPYAKFYRGLRFAGWLADKESVLVYDDFDIWQIDPSNKKKPIDVTNSYGRKNNIVFRLAGFYSTKDIPVKEDIIITAFDKSNKNSGFYRVNLESRANPVKLFMGAYIFDPGFNGSCQVKAQDTNLYVVKRESATESPNYFCTNDFKWFTQMSNVHSEKEYNWLKSELVSFTTLDGRKEQAVLYKPENFDSKRKYPIIIHYYERKSQNLNKYFKPGELSTGDLDIAWFVSHGYLVLTPDIHYRTGMPGHIS
jgi:hypothetical protein